MTLPEDNAIKFFVACHSFFKARDICCECKMTDLLRLLIKIQRNEWSGRRDSNSQPLAPKASTLPIAPRPDTFLNLCL